MKLLLKSPSVNGMFKAKEWRVPYFDKSLNRLLAAVGLAGVFAGGLTGISLFNQIRFGLERVPCFHFLHLDNLIPFDSRYYTIHGYIQEHFPDGAKVLDVGCGEGVLFPILNGVARFYTGIDLSPTAISRAQERFQKEPRAVFRCETLETLTPSAPCDVLILNEVLYYLPLKTAVNVFSLARRFLKPSGVLIVSMNKNLKAHYLWSRLNATQKPLQSIRIKNVKTGSYWTVNLYADETSKLKGAS